MMDDHNYGVHGEAVMATQTNRRNAAEGEAPAVAGVPV
jgi:hypothetical protein